MHDERFDEWSRFTVPDLRRRMAALPDADETREYGDHLLNRDFVQLMEDKDARQAAVLVPIVDRSEAEGGASVILTQRANTLRKHSGQVAFPGGSVDPEDADVEAAAIRESLEEIALDPLLVEPIGRLPRYMTVTGFRITPVVAVVRPTFALVANPAEVDAIFEVPLGFLMSEANHRRESRVWNGVTRHYYVMPFGERYIWGVTAGIIRTLYERLYA